VRDMRADNVSAMMGRRERLEKAKDGNNPALNAVFNRLETDLADALESLNAASGSLEIARKMDISEIPVRAPLTQPASQPRPRRTPHTLADSLVCCGCRASTRRRRS
jgi:hypothetical protein